MKIAHIVDSMEVGGAETLVSQLCRHQRAQGHLPFVYAVAALGDLGARLQEEGFPVQSNIGQHLWDASSSFYRIFRKSQPDVVHLHNPTPAIYAAMPARMAGVTRIVSTRHSLVAPPHVLTQELKYALAAEFCDWVVGVCDATKMNLLALHSVRPRKIVRVYNGVTPLRRVPIEQCLGRSGFTLLYVGRLEPVKNHAHLFRGLQLALSSRQDLQLWMVGDGSERRILENLAADLGIAAQVRFWGQQLDVAPFYSSADAFIMSSRSEGLPLSLLQAFSLGLPAIVTDIGGMAEAVRMAGAGFMVSPADPAEMANAILRMAQDDTERRHYSECAEAAFRSHFSLQAMADGYNELYLRSPGNRRTEQSEKTK